MIEAIVFASLFCSGLYLVGHNGLILEPLRVWLEKRFSYMTEDGKKEYWIWHPIWGCPPCMASIWGSLIWWLLATDFDKWLILWVPAIFAIALLNWLVDKLLDFLDGA